MNSSKRPKKISNEFAFLLPLSYLHGKKRFDTIYSDNDFPLRYVYVFTRYPMLGDPLRPDGKYRTGMMVYAWFIWERKPVVGKGLVLYSEPKIRWLDNNEYVLNKGDSK